MWGQNAVLAAGAYLKDEAWTSFAQDEVAAYCEGKVNR
jgi:hypothetical protein